MFVFEEYIKIKYARLMKPSKRANVSKRNQNKVVNKMLMKLK